MMMHVLITLTKRNSEMQARHFQIDRTLSKMVIVEKVVPIHIQTLQGGRFRRIDLRLSR